MEMKRKSSSRMRAIIAIAVALFLCSFLFVVGCGLLTDNGYGDFWWPLVGLTGFFTCDVGALILLLTNMKHIIQHDVEKKNEIYCAEEFTILRGIPADGVSKKLIACRFEEAADGYLRKKVFSFTKDAICYYVKCAVSTDVNETIEKELDAMDSIEERAKNVCLILFIYKDGVDKADLQAIRDVDKAFILDEEIVPRPSCNTCICVLVDGATHEGRFLAAKSKVSISVYAHGCRMIKKQFSECTYKN